MLNLSQNQLDVLSDAVTTFGKPSQYGKAIEEFTEVNLAIIHGVNRGFDSSEMVGEIADAFIMCQQLAIMHGFDSVQEAINYKVNRLEGRIYDHKTLTD